MDFNNNKNKILKFIFGGLAIFTIGMFAGYQLKNGAIASLQGYLLNAMGRATNANATNSNATSSNATSSNATSSNATSSNATSSNATSSNATSSNAAATDNILYLQSFSLANKSVKLGEKLKVNIVTSGACNTGASVVFKNVSNGATFTVRVYSINDNPYIIIPSNIVATNYDVTDVLLVGRNSNNSTFTKQYSNNSNVNSSYFNFNSTITVEKNASNELVDGNSLKLNTISITNTMAGIGDKVNLSFSASQELKSLKLVFLSSANEQLVVYVKSLSSNPYFEIPSTISSGVYTLSSATLMSDDSTIILSGDKNDSNYFEFNSTLEIVDGNADNNSYIYNNENVTSDIINKIYNANGNTTITINADSNPIINLEVFNAIKGTSKELILNYNDNQIIFNGKDITNSKTIDVSMTVGLVDDNADIASLVNNGVLVTFASNGNLPGKATVKIKSTDDMTKTLSDNEIYVYYYNESSKKFTLITKNVKVNKDGYYEFDIEHNSSYVLVNKQLDSSLVVETIDDETVSFQKGNMTYLLLIGGAVSIILVVVIVLIILKKRKGV